MEEINLEELLKFFISKIKFIALATVVFLVLGFVYVNFILTPMYHSSTTLILVGSSENQNSTTTQNDINLNKNLISTYSEIVKSRTVLQQVIDKLNLDEDTTTLSKKISVSSVENTEIIKIQVSDKNNKIAKDIASTTADVFMKEVKNIYNLTNVSVIDKASLENVPYNINIVKQLLISGVIGFVLSSGIVFLIFYFDTTIKSSKDIEEKLGLPVIGNITLIDKKGE